MTDNQEKLYEERCERFYHDKESIPHHDITTIVFTEEKRREIITLISSGQTMTFSVRKVFPELALFPWRFNDSFYYPYLGAVDVYDPDHALKMKGD